MDAFDYVEPKVAPPRRSVGPLIFNILTIIVLVMALCVVGFAALIFINPQSSINPFPPPTQITPMVFPTETTTPRPILPPTWTPAPTLEPTLTETPRPTPTPWPSNTPYGGTPTKAGPTVTPGGMSFVVKAGTIKAIPNFIHPDAGCNWMGVGGQAFDLSGAPTLGLEVRLGGTLEGRIFETQPWVTGMSPQFGPGGYEFTISDHPIASKATLWLQLLDQASLPFSDKVYFDTYSDCEKNLILIFFNQVK